MLDHPQSLTGDRKPVFKFRLYQLGSLEDIVNRQFCEFGWKRLFGPPKFTFWGGGLTPKHYFSLSRPPKGTTLAENTSYEPSCVVIGPAVWPGCGAKNTQTNKERTKTRDKLGVRPAYTLNLILTKFGMLGGLPDVFLKFEFQDDRSINRSELWGRNLLFPIDKAHRLNNSLLLLHKPWSIAILDEKIWIVVNFVISTTIWFMLNNVFTQANVENGKNYNYHIFTCKISCIITLCKKITT